MIKPAICHDIDGNILDRYAEVQIRPTIDLNDKIHIRQMSQPIELVLGPWYNSCMHLWWSAAQMPF